MGRKNSRDVNKPQLIDGVKARLAQSGVTHSEGKQPDGAPSVAAALSQLMEPYMTPDMSLRQHELVLAIAVLAWNCSLLTEEEAQQDDRAMQANFDFEEQGDLVQIIAAMQVRKEELFPWGTQAVLDAQLEFAGPDLMKLTVVPAVKQT